jgi:hypothetical protein
MPSVEVLEKVADMAGESLDWLFGREDKTISNEERRLLRFFRGTSEEGQEIVLETVEDIFFDHPKRWWYCYHCLILSLFFMGCYMRKSLEDELLGVVKELSTEALNRILVIAKSAKNRNASCCFLCAFLCIKRSTTNLSSALDEASNTLSCCFYDKVPLDNFAINCYILPCSAYKKRTGKRTERVWHGRDGEKQRVLFFYVG